MPVILPMPSLTDVRAYLADLGSAWTDEEVTDALRTERAAQAQVCRTPADDEEWPADLAEALRRRVAHNLALRALPLGLQTNLTESAVATNRVGGTDAEVRRLEAPFRKWVLG